MVGPMCSDQMLQREEAVNREVRRVKHVNYIGDGEAMRNFLLVDAKPTRDATNAEDGNHEYDRDGCIRHQLLADPSDPAPWGSVTEPLP